MQVDGKQKDRKETYHLELILERLFKYMFQKDFWVIKKKTTKKKKPRRSCNMFQIASEEQQRDFQGPWKKKTNLRLEKH